MKLKFMMMAFALLFASLGAAQAAQNQQGSQSQSDSMQAGNGQGHYAQVNGEKIHYQVSGQGQPLLLIHGYPLNGNLFMKQRQSLSKQFKVITPDLPGFGRSSALNGQASLEAYAKDMFGLLDKLGVKKAVIGGHSMGGMTTLEMYKEQPDRFKGMILIDTAAIAAPLPREKLWDGYAQLAKKPGNHTKTMDKLLIPNMLSDQTRMHDKQVVKEMKNMVKAASAEGVIGGGHALANRPDYTGLLSRIDVPTLIIVGSEDTITPISLAKNMHKKIKGSKLAIIHGASHAAILEKAQQADQAITQWMGHSKQHSQQQASR